MVLNAAIKVSMIKKIAAEFFATFCLVFCGTGSIIVHEMYPQEISNTGIALSFGLIVMIMIISFGNVSGSNMNPVVTLALSLLKK